MADLQDIEAIKRVKYKYLRCLDTKNWEEMADCFVVDATCAYEGGKYTFQGRDEVIGFLRDALGPSTMITMHQVHHPEIEVTSEGAARGTWYLEDFVIDTKSNTMLSGTAFYHDEYVKVGGDWRLKTTGYERIFMETQNRGDIPSLKITRM